MNAKAKKFLPVNVDQKLNEIGGKVRLKRKAIDNNYVNFAAEHKINKVTLQRIEFGDNFKMSSLLEVLNAIGISLEDLLK